ncbi:chemotaxis protein CheX [Geomonas sp. RF6]|uniref:chemotaxis protein CheX n=1 Tax=Geomonas sp. RF6 TaxID=2897342 RepID=UPI001E62DFA2|nr:chemotaxis protein CheX [Geomonas sp. RF6]UFS70775.1 chemotaxis protein CheX [Geomonas sp. RF6]
MAVKFFGQFLVEKNIVSREAILEAIKLQDSVNLRFGDTALSINLICQADMERVHAAQRTEDLKFGDMAVKLGILTNEQVNQVLTVQKNSHLYLGEALVQIGAVQEQDLPRLLDDYKADQEPYLTPRIEIPTGVRHPDLWEMYADLTAKMFTRIVGTACRLGACRVEEHMPEEFVVATMEIRGDAEATCIFAGSAEIRQRIACAILGEESVDEEPEDVLNDSVKEFLNIVCGNVAAKAAQKGKTIEILPPHLVHPASAGISVPSGSRGLFFTLHLSTAERASIGVIEQS